MFCCFRWSNFCTIFGVYFLYVTYLQMQIEKVWRTHVHKRTKTTANWESVAYACSQKNSKPMLCSKPRENQKTKKPNFLEKFWFQVQRCFFWFSLSFLNCRWFKNPDRLKQSGRGSKQKLCPNPSLHPTSNIGLPPQCQKGQQAHQRKLGSNLLDRDFVTESHGKGKGWRIAKT